MWANISLQWFIHSSDFYKCVQNQFWKPLNYINCTSQEDGIVKIVKLTCMNNWGIAFVKLECTKVFLVVSNTHRVFISWMNERRTNITYDLSTWCYCYMSFLVRLPTSLLYVLYNCTRYTKLHYQDRI